MSPPAAWAALRTTWARLAECTAIAAARVCAAPCADSSALVRVLANCVWAIAVTPRPVSSAVSSMAPPPNIPEMRQRRLRLMANVRVVADAEPRQDKPRLGRIPFELAPQAADVHVHR